MANTASQRFLTLYLTPFCPLLECLAGCVLWDNDYELQDSLDLPPDESRRFRNLLGMPDDYYTDFPHDPPDKQVQLYLDALMGLKTVNLRLMHKTYGLMIVEPTASGSVRQWMAN